MILNYTQHPITLAPTPDPATWVTLPSSGCAVLFSTAGAPEQVDGCPVPVVGAPTFGDIEGLPEVVQIGSLIVVSFPVAQRVKVERAGLELARASCGDVIERHRNDELGARARDELDVIERKLFVLSCVVGLGTGPEDKPIRWTAADAAAGLCTDKQVGTPRAVTRLVRT